MPRTPAPQPKAKPRWKLALRVVAWGTLLAGMAWGGRRVESFLEKDSRFALECLGGGSVCSGVEIHGATYASQRRIAQVFGADYGRSILQIPLAERRRHLLAIDWVNTAAITRVWPNRLVVTVTERSPVAYAKLPAAPGRYRMALVDKDGVLLSIPPRSRFHLPVLSGINEDQRDAERKMRVSAMQHLFDDLGPEAGSVSEVNAASIQDMRLITNMDGHAVELWIGDQHYRSRFANFVKHFPQIRRSSENASIFDLRLDDRISAR